MFCMKELLCIKNYKVKKQNSKVMSDSFYVEEIYASTHYAKK